MPPKKKDKRKEPSIQRPPTLINGLSKEEISKEQLEEHIMRLQGELDTEREESKDLQMQKEQIHTLQKTRDREREENEAKLKHLEKVGEDEEGHHKSRIKLYKQKMKYLLCEHQNTISELKAGGLISTNTCQKEHDERETELYKTMTATRVEIQNFDIENRVRELELIKERNEKEMTTTRDNWERLLTNTKAKAVEKMQLEQQKMEHIVMNTTDELKLQSENFMKELKKDHKDIISAFKNVLHSSSVDMVTADDLEEKIEAVGKMKQEKRSVQQTNCDLTELISKLGEKIANGHAALKSRSKDIKMPKRTALENLKADHEVMEQKFSKLQLERDELSKSVPEKIKSVQDKDYQENRLLEVQLQTLEDHLEEVQAQLYSVLSSPNMDHTALAEVAHKAKESVEFKNATIKELEYKKKTISKACKDLQLTAETRDLFS